SRTGVTLRLRHRVRHGNVLYVSLPLPQRLRSHGMDEPEYRVYALVRRVHPVKDGIRVTALEFVGEQPPIGYLDKPWATFQTQPWTGAERRRVLGKILSSAGYEVVLVEDGKAAVEKAAEMKPDLVITDGLMPKMHGFLVCKALKEMRPAPKVIMLTAVYTKLNYRFEARDRYGADE